jgi:putative phosphoribosyl transferase
MAPLQTHCIGPATAADAAALAQSAGAVLFVQPVDRHEPLAWNRTLGEVLEARRLIPLLLEPALSDDGVSAAGPVDLRALGRHLRAVLERLHGSVDRRPGTIGAMAGGLAARVLLEVAADEPGRLAALVCCGGRRVLPAGLLRRIQAPTLLIVGSRDVAALAANRRNLRGLVCQKRLETVPDADERMDSPGATDTVGHLAGAWFSHHLRERFMV